jgi:hypothetical protein
VPIDDPVAVRYVNEMLRPLGNLLIQALDRIDLIQLDRRPDAKDLDGLFPEDGGAVEDNRGAEGLSPVAAAHVRALFRLCEVIRAMADDDRDPATGAHTGVTSRGLLRRFGSIDPTRG